MVVGDQQRFVSAIILPAREKCTPLDRQAWSGGPEHYSELLAHPQLLACFLPILTGSIYSSYRADQNLSLARIPGNR